LRLVTDCALPYFKFSSHHPHKLTHRSHSQMAFGRTTNILYLLTCAVNCPAIANHAVELHSCKFRRSGETFQCICTSVNCQTMSYTGQDAWHA